MQTSNYRAAFLRVLFPKVLPYRIAQFMQRLTLPAKALERFADTYQKKLKDSQ